MPAGGVRRVPVLLVPAAVLWTVHTAGVVPELAAVLATVVAVALVVWGAGVLGRRVPVSGPVMWAGLLVGWTAAVALARPVCFGMAGYLVAGGAVAAGLLLAAMTPRGGYWGGIALAAAGLAAAGWLVAEALWLGGRPGGPTGNPNLSAAACLVTLAALPAIRIRPAVRLMLAAAMLGGIAASGSRGALLGAVLLGLLWAVRRKGRLRWLAAGVALAALAGGVARLSSDRDPLRWERLRIWGVAVRTVRAELPLGAGPGGYFDAALPHNFPRDGEFARYHRLPGLAESDWLQLLATLGLPGLFLAAGLGRALARFAGPWTAGVVLVQAAASSVNTLLAFPPVLWTAALAVGLTLRPPVGSTEPGPASAQEGPDLRRRAALGTPVAAAFLVLAAGTAAGWLMWPLTGDSPEDLVELAGARVRAAPFDPYLADAEMPALAAVQRRPRFARAWETLGRIRLLRAEQSRDPRLLFGSGTAFEAALRHNPNAVFAALGKARVRRLAGDDPGARVWLQRAVATEPNFAVAWLELAALERQGGRLEAACRAVTRAQAALDRAAGIAMVSDYERALVRVDEDVFERLAAACGGP